MADRKPQDQDRYIVRFPDGMRDRLKSEASENGRSLNAEIVQRLETALDEDSLLSMVRDPNDVERGEATRLAATFGRFLLKAARNREFANPDELKIFIADMLFEFGMPLEQISSEGSILVNLDDGLVKKLSQAATSKARDLGDEIEARLDASFKEEGTISSELTEQIKELVRAQRRSQYLFDKALEALSSNDLMLDLAKIAKEMPEELKNRLPVDKK